jgi:predicted transcriptional regulator
MTLASALRAEMVRLKLTQYDVATRVGLSQPTIQAYLSGAEPKLDAFKLLVRAFPSLVAVIYHAEGD